MSSWTKFHELRQGGDVRLAKLEYRAEKADMELQYIGRLFWQQYKVLKERIKDANQKYIDRLRELGFEIERDMEVVFHVVQEPAYESVIVVDPRYNQLIEQLQYIADNDYLNPVGQKVQEILLFQKQSVPVDPLGEGL